MHEANTHRAFVSCVSMACTQYPTCVRPQHATTKGAHKPASAWVPFFAAVSGLNAAITCVLFASVCHCFAAGAGLDPRQLLPALVRFGEPGTEPAKREQVLKYVAFAMEQLRCTDRCVLDNDAEVFALCCQSLSWSRRDAVLKQQAQAHTDSANNRHGLKQAYTAAAPSHSGPGTHL